MKEKWNEEEEKEEKKRRKKSDSISQTWQTNDFNKFSGQSLLDTSAVC